MISAACLLIFFKLTRVKFHRSRLWPAIQSLPAEGGSKWRRAFHLALVTAFEMSNAPTSDWLPVICNFPTTYPGLPFTWDKHAFEKLADAAALRENVDRSFVFWNFGIFGNFAFRNDQFWLFRCGTIGIGINNLTGTFSIGALSCSKMLLPLFFTSNASYRTVFPPNSSYGLCLRRALAVFLCQVDATSNQSNTDAYFLPHFQPPPPPPAPSSCSSSAHLTFIQQMATA